MITEPDDLAYEDLDKVVVHRNIPGEHEISRSCWCRPGVFEPEEKEAIERFAEGDRPS